jgi:hypothetical protein
MIEARLKKIGNEKVDREALFIAGDIIYPGDRYMTFPNHALKILQANPRVEIKGQVVVQDHKGLSKDKFEGTPDEFAALHFKTVEKYLPTIEDLEFLEAAQKLAKSAVLDRINARIEELHK